MSSPTTCHEIFNAARAQRTKYPLTKGRYKLRDAEHAVEDWRRLINTIGERVRTGGKFGINENLGPCMAPDRGTYLKSIPARLAERIGYNILPGIAALEGDGVPKAEVQHLLHRAETDAQRLLDDCEAVRLHLKGGIDHEYRAMRQRESHFYGLLEDALGMTKLKSAAPVAPPRADSSPPERVACIWLHFLRP